MGYIKPCWTVSAPGPRLSPLRLTVVGNTATLRALVVSWRSVSPGGGHRTPPAPLP